MATTSARRANRAERLGGGLDLETLQAENNTEDVSLRRKWEYVFPAVRSL